MFLLPVQMFTKHTRTCSARNSPRIKATGRTSTASHRLAALRPLTRPAEKDATFQALLWGSEPRRLKPRPRKTHFLPQDKTYTTLLRCTTDVSIPSLPKPTHAVEYSGSHPSPLPRSRRTCALQAIYHKCYNAPFVRDLFSSEFSTRKAIVCTPT